MSRDRPKYLHVLVYLHSQTEPEEFYKITEIRENGQYDMLELLREQKIVGFFDKETVERLEVKGDV